MHQRVEIDYYLYRYAGNEWHLVGVYKSESTAWEMADSFAITRIIKTTSELLP